MMWISFGRGTANDYGNINDLDPKRYNMDQMPIISRGRGDSSVYGNIDDLEPEKHDSEEMFRISLSRGEQVNI